MKIIDKEEIGALVFYAIGFVFCATITTILLYDITFTENAAVFLTATLAIMLFSPFTLISGYFIVGYCVILFYRIFLNKDLLK